MNAYVSQVIDALKERDEKRSEDFRRTQHELDLKLASQKEVFEALGKQLAEAANEIQIALYRPVVRYQETLKPGKREAESFALIGEGSDTNRIDVTPAKDGRIVYAGPLVPDGRHDFNPAVENGDYVRWYGNNGIVRVEEMAQVLLSIITQLK